MNRKTIAGYSLLALGILYVHVPSCGAKPTAGGDVAELKGSEKTDPADDSDKSGIAPFTLQFTTLKENLVPEEGAPISIAMTFSHSSEGKWSICISEKNNGLVGSTALAKDLDLSQSTFEWDVSSVPPGSYFITVVVEHRGETRVFQPRGTVVIPDRQKNNAPFVKIVQPNNTYRINNDEVDVIDRNRDRRRIGLNEPVRIVYQFLDFEDDPITLSLIASTDEKNWITLQAGIVPTKEEDDDSQDYVLEWTPPADFDKNTYTLRLVASDGRAEGFGEQKYIGIGDVNWETDIAPVHAQYCATAGCHDATTAANRRNYTIYDNIEGYNDIDDILNGNCTSCHGEGQQLGGVRLDGADNAIASAARIKAVIEAGTMPRSGGGATQAQIDDAAAKRAAATAAQQDATTKRQAANDAQTLLNTETSEHDSYAPLVTALAELATAQTALDNAETALAADPMDAELIAARNAAETERDNKQAALDTLRTTDTTLIQLAADRDAAQPDFNTKDTAADTAEADAATADTAADAAEAVVANANNAATTVTPLGNEARQRLIDWVNNGALRQSRRGAADNDDHDNQLVKYWAEPVGSENRDRKAMPKGRPLPPEVLGKLLMWDMRGGVWNEGNRRYDNRDNLRQQRN